MSYKVGSKTESNVTTKKQDRMIFKTWDDLFHHIGIVPMRFSFMNDAEYVLRMLRTDAPRNYKESYQRLLDSFLDEVVEAYSERSTFAQLCALGTALQELGLRLCYMKDSDGYRIWVMQFEDTQTYLDFWKPYLTRRQFFNTINTFAMRDGERLDAPYPDINRELFQDVKQVRMPYSKEGCPGDVYILSGTDTTGIGTLKHFLCVPAFTENGAFQQKTLRVYDAETFRPLEASIDFDRDNLEPYTLRIYDGALGYLFVGDSLTKANGWKPVRYRSNGEAIPVYERDNDNAGSDQERFPYWNTLDVYDTVIGSDGRYAYSMNHKKWVQKYDCVTGDVWKIQCDFLPDAKYIRPFVVEGVLWFFCVYPGIQSDTQDMLLWCPVSGEILSGSDIQRKPYVTMDCVMFCADIAYVSFVDGRVCLTKPFEQLLEYFYEALKVCEKSFSQSEWVLLQSGCGAYRFAGLKK